MRTVLACTIAGCLLAASSGYAHHSFAAEFDADKPVKLVGTVTKVEWTNPHAWFYIDVKDDSGKVENWGWELGSPTSLVRLGWSRNALRVGQLVTVEGSRSRDGSNTANTRSIILNSTGQRLFGGSSQGQNP